ncbi:hypothetical protein EDB89DRAFT_1914259 [Lactarius sanguifluus]|nr:hypothetical protein EDB89DRAFT_1914259 [Lactarius sanguifluus]
MSYCVSRHTGTGSVVELAMQKVTFFGNNRKSESNADIIRKPNVQATHPCNWFTTMSPLPRRFTTRQLVAPISPHPRPPPPVPRRTKAPGATSRHARPTTHATTHFDPAMAATTNPSPRHPTWRTRPQPPTHQHDATTRLARPHNRQPTATHPDPVRKATNPVTVTSQHGAQDYNPPPPTHCHTPTWRPTPQPPTHCHSAAHDAQDSATANPRYAATAHTHYIIPRRDSTAASYNLA